MCCNRGEAQQCCELHTVVRRMMHTHHEQEAELVFTCSAVEVLASSQVLRKLCGLHAGHAALLLRVHVGSKLAQMVAVGGLAGAHAVEQLLLHVLGQPGVLAEQQGRVGGSQGLEGQCGCVEAVEVGGHAVGHAVLDAAAVWQLLQTHKRGAGIHTRSSKSAQGSSQQPEHHNMHVVQVQVVHKQ